MQEKEQQVRTLQAKVEKKRFKSQQQKQMIVESQQQLGQQQSLVV